MSESLVVAKASTTLAPTSARFILRRTANSLLALVLASGGAYLLYVGAIISGGGGLILAILAATEHKGIELDLKTRQYRLYTSILGLRMGDWEPLPEVQHVTMKYFSDLVTSGRPGRIRTDQAKRYVVMFSLPNSPQGVVIQQGEEYEAALGLTDALAAALQVEAKVYGQI
ncbi:hypothetical protein KBK19_15120 [Microvirga sp. STR05]|uniref:DUF3137 domain-containing protein n=1 Tax=Hymenobacter duratus TaxID=2771356 RepID=A0ABR8JHQ4_9BACT|nr:hypothetical protein [Hymenobacter duratus]MBD2716370.1 hypothetical protein [Hymenobacter duratus]MBR7951285.1 hypothetical protein [Microvirga sp. STR05]